MKKFLPILFSLLVLSGCYTQLTHPERDKSHLEEDDEPVVEIVKVVPPVFIEPAPPSPPSIRRPIILLPLPPESPQPVVEKERSNDNLERSRSKKDSQKSLRNNSGERSSQSGRKR